MQVSFIIPHKGRTEMLAQTVASIWQQDFAGDQFEVIVVTQNQDLDNGLLTAGDGRTAKLVFQTPDKTISASRNLGVRHAKGDYLAFLDADVELSSNWIKAMLAELNSAPDRVLVSAMQQCNDSAPPLEKIRTALSNADVDCNLRFLPGRNLLLARETFFAAGQFPEHLITCEDYYFTDQVHKHGKLFYSSAATYIHLGEDKILGEMYKKEIWRGQSNIQSIKGRNIPFSEIPSFIVPVWIAFFALMAVVSLLFISVNAAVGCIAAALLPIVIYAFRLYKLPSNTVSYWQILKFYLVYFPARIVGTFGGVIKAVELKQQ
ncbi:family 2 glycosyl transferase [Catenovulum agarivorans DS-2]|uniref:Family 2 glycosyl transferase n=1 Tax=Catenovulum agarivorans DS-2 TaxID=1328313 RepID=W7QQ83_9ALTE|nr:glycosyltransferase family A protein [Catenovulum agarivorans]EWH11137.1 family 2 glycosyl transferase [Catenovulum agarivorans DS-2]